MDIVCLGELLVDMYPVEVGRRLAEVSAFRPTPGGAPANVAVAAARLGMASAFIGKVGDDAFGRFLATVLEREGVTTRGVRFDRRTRTTMAFIAMPDENSAEFMFYRHPGADTLLSVEELDRDLLREARVFHFGSVSLTDEPSRTATLEAARLARGAGALVSFDVNYRPTLWTSPSEAHETISAALAYVNLLKVNEVELPLLSGVEDVEAGSRALLERGPHICVVTLGRKGSFYQTVEGGEHVPGFVVPTVDAIGCGDAFVAALLTSLISSGDWRAQLVPGRMRRLVRYANAAGALTAQQRGVIPALPTAAAIEAFLARCGE